MGGREGGRKGASGSIPDEYFGYMEICDGFSAFTARKGGKKLISITVDELFIHAEEEKKRTVFIVL